MTQELCHNSKDCRVRVNMNLGTGRAYITSLLLFIFLTLPSDQLEAQFNSLGYPHIKNFDRSDYNLGLHPLMLSQSKKGIVYGANHESLTQFDGRKWNKLEVPLWTNVLSVLAADDGRVYVGCTNTLGYFDSDTDGEMAFYSLLDKVPEHQRNFEEVWKIYETDFGIVFQSIRQIMILENNDLSIFQAPSSLHFSFYTDNTLYVVDNELGVMRFLDGEFQILKGTQVLTGKEVSAILQHKEGLMIATQFDGVYLYREGELIQWKSPVATQLKRDQVYCVQKIGTNQIAFGTVQNGLIITTDEGSPLLAMNESNGLQSNTIQSMLLSGNGDLWLGTNNGVDLLHISRPLSQIKQQNGIGTGYTAISHQGYLYLGTNRGVFYREWNKGQAQANQINVGYELIPETKGQVWSLQIIDNQVLCGHHDGAFILEKGKAKKITDINGIWTFLKPHGHQDHLLAGTYNGLIAFSREEKTWEFSHKIRDFDESSRVLIQDKRNTLWMGHGYKGVFRLRLNNELNKVIDNQLYNSKNGLPTDHSINLTSFQDNILFLTPEGVFEYEDATGQVQQSTKYTDFFPFSEIGGALEDNEGNIWYYSQGTLGVKRKQEDGSYNDIRLPFNVVKDQFLRGFEFTYPIDRENIIIANENGFIHYNSTLSKDYRNKFHAFIGSTKTLNNDSILFRGHQFEADMAPVSLTYSENDLYFSFYAVDFEDFNQLQFATFLEGYDKNWSGWNPRTEREFTNLREGSYSFKVKGKNVFGTESTVASYNFTVAPPIYRSNLAYGIYLVFMISTFYFGRRQIRTKHQKQLNKREQELRQETLIAEREVIKLRNEQLVEKVKHKDRELANSTMMIIQKNRIIKSVKKKLIEIADQTSESDAKTKIKKLVSGIEKENNNSKDLKLFEANFANVHGDFLVKIKARYPELSPAELRLCSCLRMNISSKEIAELLNLSMRSVESSRYRLRRTLNLGHDENLTDFILSI